MLNYVNVNDQSILLIGWLFAYQPAAPFAPAQMELGISQVSHSKSNLRMMWIPIGYLAIAFVRLFVLLPATGGAFIIILIAD